MARQSTVNMEEENKIAEETIAPAPASEPIAQEEIKVEEDDEVKRRREHLENINKAIAESNRILREKREQIKATKTDPDELPKIDLDDPSSKAWDKHIRENVNPIRSEMEEEKKEIRTFALEKFLADKPALAKDTEKVKELVMLYDKIKTATERTTEGVLRDLQKAYAALHSEELIATARGQRIEKAQADSTFSDIAVSRNTSTYQQPKKKDHSKELSKEDELILARWGTTPQEWAADKEKYGG